MSGSATSPRAVLAVVAFGVFVAADDLMVVATHGRVGVDRWLHREIAQKLARSRAINTLFVPYGEEGFVSPTKGTVELHQVLLPVDWIPAPQAAVDTAADPSRLSAIPASSTAVGNSR